MISFSHLAIPYLPVLSSSAGVSVTSQPVWAVPLPSSRCPAAGPDSAAAGRWWSGAAPPGASPPAATGAPLKHTGRRTHEAAGSHFLISFHPSASSEAVNCLDTRDTHAVQTNTASIHLDNRQAYGTLFKGHTCAGRALETSSNAVKKCLVTTPHL